MVGLMNAYFILKNFVFINKNSNEILKEVELNNSQSLKDLSSSYKTFLEVEGKAKDTVKNYIKEIDKFLDFIKSEHNTIESLDRILVFRYLKKTREDRCLTTNPYSKLVVIIRSFLKFLHKNKIIFEDLYLDLKVPKKVKKEMEFLSKKDIDSIESYLEKRKEKYRNETLRDKVILYLALHCGLRKSEIDYKA
jgi:integrase/recombinase XerD